jgi:hypothetical protein
VKVRHFAISKAQRAFTVTEYLAVIAAACTSVTALVWARAFVSRAASFDFFHVGLVQSSFCWKFKPLRRSVQVFVHG